MNLHNYKPLNWKDQREMRTLVFIMFTLSKSLTIQKSFAKELSWFRCKRYLDETIGNRPRFSMRHFKMQKFVYKSRLLVMNSL